VTPCEVILPESLVPVKPPTDQADDLHAGRTPRLAGDGLTVADMCNRFLTAKQRKLEALEIGPRMFGKYKVTTDRLVTTFGKSRLVDDLAKAQGGNMMEADEIHKLLDKASPQIKSMLLLGVNARQRRC